MNMFPNIVASSCKPWREEPCGASTALRLQTASVNRSQSGFVLEDCGKWNICYCKCSLKRAACCSATLWLSEPVGLFVTSPCFVDALWLFPSRCPSSLFCLPPSHFSSLLVVFDVRCLAAAVCHVVLLGQALLLRASVSPSLVMTYSLCSMIPPSSVLWQFFVVLLFLSWPLLICSAPDTHLCMSHWSLSADLSITLSLLSPSLPPPCVVWSHAFAVRDLFLPTRGCRGVFHQRCLYQHQAHRASSLCGFIFLRNSVQGELFSACCTHVVRIAISVCH